MLKSIFALSFVMMFSLQSLAQEAQVFWSAEKLHESEQCLLQLVRTKMKVKTPADMFPRIRFETEVPFDEYQDAIEKWWGVRPEFFNNTYDVPNNTIYVTNNMRWYKSPRTPMDSLVHELAHFVQVRDLKIGDGDADHLEAQAIEVQTWFRENRAQFIRDQKYEGDCF
ncbi:hypothetical protein D3C87_701410 [compost metagenome]